MAEKKNTRYTYAQFATDVVELVSRLEEMTAGDELSADFDFDKMFEKAQTLLEQQNKKAEYNANKRAQAAGQPKELSEKMKALIALVKPAIPKGEENAVTGADINKITGENLYAMQISNACAHIENCMKTKVIRETTNNKGLKQQKEYTAYYIAG